MRKPMATTSAIRIAIPASALKKELLPGVLLRDFCGRLFLRVGFRLAINCLNF
jgi:hypothetical protein